MGDSLNSHICMSKMLMMPAKNTYYVLMPSSAQHRAEAITVGTAPPVTRASEITGAFLE